MDDVHSILRGSLHRLLAMCIPYAAVLVGLYWLESAWISMLGATTRIKETTLADPRWLPESGGGTEPVAGSRPAPPPTPERLREMLD